MLKRTEAEIHRFNLQPKEKRKIKELEKRVKAQLFFQASEQ